jgi:hypothetical protein
MSGHRSQGWLEAGWLWDTVWNVFDGLRIVLCGEGS